MSPRRRRRHFALLSRIISGLTENKSGISGSAVACTACMMTLPNTIRVRLFGSDSRRRNGGYRFVDRVIATQPGPRQRQDKKERANTGIRMARPVEDRPGAESAVQFTSSRLMLLRSGHSSVFGLVERCPLHPRPRLSIRPAFLPAASGSTRHASVRREF